MRTTGLSSWAMACRPWAGRMAMAACTAAILGLTLVGLATFACSSPVSPTSRCAGKVDCDGYCCDPGYACCGKFAGTGTCCPSSMPHYCANTNKCYQYFTDAQQACGTSYVICGSGR